VGAIAQWTSPRISLLSGAIATVIAAGLLMWRHESGLKQERLASDKAASTIEAMAVQDVESKVA
jgi:hypothetical protein